MIDDDQDLGQGHEPLSPERVHDLIRLSRIVLLDRDEYEIVKDALGGHVVIHDLGNRQLEKWEKDSFCRVPEIKVLHRWTADDRCRKDWLLPHRDRRDVHLRI